MMLLFYAGFSVRSIRFFIAPRNSTLVIFSASGFKTHTNTPVLPARFTICNVAYTWRLSLFRLTALLETFLLTTTAAWKVGRGV